MVENHTPKFENVVNNLQKQAVDNSLNREENDAIKLALEKEKDELKVDVKEDQKNKKKSAGSMLSK